MRKILFATILTNSLLTTNICASNVLLDKLVIKVIKLVKPNKNYRQTALSHSPKVRGGWIKDPYSGRTCRKKDAHVDHIWPKSKGGPNYTWNLILSCPQDNISKSNKVGVITLYGYKARFEQFLKQLF